MWYIHYGLHIQITHSFFKRRHRMCSKAHQIYWKQANGYIFETNWSSIEHQYKKLGDGFNKKMRNNKHTCPMFDNKLLASSKQIKCVPEIFFFQSKRRKYVNTIPGVLCLVDWCLTISLWIYLKIPQNKQRIKWRRIYFPKSRMIQFTHTKYFCRIIRGITKYWYKKDITVT